MPYNIIYTECLHLYFIKDYGTAHPPTKKVKFDESESARQFKLANDKHTTTIPNPFPFPKNYPPAVECALHAKIVPQEILNRFLAVTARAIYAIKCYPRSNEYDAIGVQIIQKYPFLKSPIGCPYVSFNYLMYA